MSLTLEEVNEFIVEKLKIADWQLKIKENKLQFLHDFVFAYFAKASKQNVPFCAVPKPERKYPTIQDAIYYGKKMIGTCIHLNYFLKLVFEQLGYDTFIVASDVPIWPVARMHMVTIIRFRDPDPKKEELYLVDAGFGRPLLEVIPLHNLPYQFKSAGFLVEYKFNSENQTYERIAHGGCPVRGKFKPEAPTNVEYLFDLKPIAFEDMTECYEDIFSPRGNSTFMDGLFMFRMTNVRTKDDYDYVAFRNIVLIEGTPETIKETVHETYEEMLPAIKKYFPDMNWTELAAAFVNYNNARAAKLAALKAN